MTAHTRRDCDHCGKRRDHIGRGLCGTCYRRWTNGGRQLNIDGRPVIPDHPRQHWSTRVRRLRRFTALRRQGLSVGAAADILRVSYRTAERYEKERGAS